MPEHKGPALIDPEGSRHDLTQRQFEVIVAMASRLGLDIMPSSGATCTVRGRNVLRVRFVHVPYALATCCV